MSRLSIDAICTSTEPEPDWLIPNLIHRGSFILFCGLAGSGKSFFSYALGAALATGTQIIDNAAIKARVLYLDEENSHPDLSAYLRWTWRGLGEPSLDLLRANLRLESRTLMTTEKWWIEFRNLAVDFKPDLIIVDTATPAFHILDENSNAEASLACRRIRAAQDASGPRCSALILKHLRRDHATGRLDVRGAKHWKAAVDSVWYHSTRPGKPRLDGLRGTCIRPDKTRAYGLREELHIHPVGEIGKMIKLEISRHPYSPPGE